MNRLLIGMLLAILMPCAGNVWSTEFYVIAGGNVTALNGASADSVGIIYAIGRTPVIGDSVVVRALSPAMASPDTFSVLVTNVIDNAASKYKLFVTNSAGRGYGPEGTWAIARLYTEITTEITTALTTEIK